MSQSAIELISKKLRDEEIDIEDAIESGDLPETLLHQLACDCIDRALQRLKSIGKDPEEQSWKALLGKRAWLVKELNDEELAELQEEVMTTDTTTAWGVVRRNAHNSARNSVRSVVGTATEAVTWSKRNDANYEERTWIKRRIAYLCATWSACGEKAPQLLQNNECPIDCPDDAEINFQID